MSGFKEQIAKDNKNIFMNLDEFSETHVINGKEMSVLIDNNEMVNRETRYKWQRGLYGDGVYVKELLIYVRAEEFGALPAIGRTLTFDKKTYLVSDAINEDGIYSLSLEAHRT